MARMKRVSLSPWSGGIPRMGYPPPRTNRADVKCSRSWITGWSSRQVGILASPTKADLADKLTTFHYEYAAVPNNLVYIVFHKYPIGSGFTAVRESSTAAPTVLIWSGRSSDYKQEFLKHL